MSGSYDALVIGGGVGGLTAAAYLARGGASVCLLEAGGTIGAVDQNIADGVRAPAAALFALDPRMVKELKLARRGLRFVLRDVPLVGMRSDGKHLVIGRDVHAAARSIAAHAPGDGEAFARYRNEFFALARALRPWWWEASENAEVLDAQHGALDALKLTGTAAFLGGWFESDALKAALSFDATSALSPNETGSALTLLWRAAQEMCGLQGALAVLSGGAGVLKRILLSVAQDAGVEVRTKARVAKLVLADDAIAGVALDSGEMILAPTVLSSLSRRATLCELAPIASAGFAEVCRLARAPVGEASVIFVLNAPPSFAGQPVPVGGRLVFAERLESHVVAHAAARAGRLPDELVMEAMLATETGLAPPGQHILRVRVRDLPVTPHEGWETLRQPLGDAVVALLERHAHGLKSSIVARFMHTPEAQDDDPLSVAHILAPAAARIRTPIPGLFLCGNGVEPVNVVSGRAGRLAAAMALAQHRAT